MKPILLSLFVALLSACATERSTGVRITLGKPTHKVEPPSSIIAGYKSVDFPVRLTNISKRPVWFYSPLPEPFYDLYIRDNATGRWRDETQLRCGVGIDFQRLESGQSISSSVSVPADEIGCQIRVETSIYAAPHSKPHSISSEATAIR